MLGEQIINVVSYSFLGSSLVVAHIDSGIKASMFIFFVTM